MSEAIAELGGSAKSYSEMFDEFNIPLEHRSPDYFRIEYGPDNQPYPIPTQILFHDECFNLGERGELTHPTAVIAKTVLLGNRAIIHALVELNPGVEVGDNSTIEPGATLDTEVYAGKNVIIGAKSSIYSEVRIGDDSVIGDHTHIFSNAYIESRVNIGNKVTINSDATLFNGVRVEDEAYIGTDSGIGRGARIHERANIGSDVEIGESVTIHRSATVGDSAKVDDYSAVGPGVRIKEKQKVKYKRFVVPKGFKPEVEKR